MAEQQDTFWKLFFTAAAGCIALAGFVIGILFLKPSTTPPTLPHADSSEPYAYAGSLELTATSTYFYRESIPLGYSNTSWGATTNWRSQERQFEGSYAARVEFMQEWGGLSLAGHGIPTASYGGISFVVFAEPGIHDLYLELQNKAGVTIGRQSVGWYFPQGRLEAGVWQVITIPLSNFSTIPTSIGGFAIMSKEKGVAYVDDVHLVTSAPAHTAWAPAPEVAGAQTDNSLTALFARANAILLPYTLSLTPESIAEWYAADGQFAITPETLRIGPPLNGGSTYAVFLGGLAWTNYRADAVVDWGPALTFSLVARITGDSSHVACGFSAYGGTVQIYVLRSGKSELVAETPYLGVPAFDAWSKVPLAIEVTGNQVACFVRGERALSATLKDMSLYGSVGIEVWDTNTMQQPHNVRSFTVTPL